MESNRKQFEVIYDTGETLPHNILKNKKKIMLIYYQIWIVQMIIPIQIKIIFILHLKIRKILKQNGSRQRKS